MQVFIRICAAQSGAVHQTAQVAALALAGHLAFAAGVTVGLLESRLPELVIDTIALPRVGRTRVDDDRVAACVNCAFSAAAASDDSLSLFEAALLRSFPVIVAEARSPSLVCALLDVASRLVERGDEAASVVVSVAGARRVIAASRAARAWLPRRLGTSMRCSWARWIAGTALWCLWLVS